MLNDKQIRDLVQEYGTRVNQGRSVRELIADRVLPFPSETVVKEGKVSDSVYGPTLWTRDNKPIRLMFRNSRISTHDVVRGEVPFKDQSIALVHEKMRQLTKEAIGTSQFDIPGLKPTSCVIAAENLELIMVEFVIRKYLAKSSTSTSMWVAWQKALEDDQEVLRFAGHDFLMRDLYAHCELPEPIDTPSTKAESDETITPGWLVAEGVCTKEQYGTIKSQAMKAFGIVAEYVETLGMVLVDTKTEHGINTAGEIVSADELYTMDSSRFWQRNNDGSILMDDKGNPVSFSKQFARDMVVDEKAQQFTQEQLNEIGVRYINACQLITGEEFVPDLRPREERIANSVKLIVDHLT